MPRVTSTLYALKKWWINELMTPSAFKRAVRQAQARALSHR